MFWFSVGIFIGQNEELLLLSHLAKTYRFGDLKIEFQSLVYIFSGSSHLKSFIRHTLLKAVII